MDDLSDIRKRLEEMSSESTPISEEEFEELLAKVRLERQARPIPIEELLEPGILVDPF